MPENLGYQFDRLYAAPIETYRQVNTITNRNAIPPEIRWEGMECYVVSENQDYQLVGGVDNSNWVNAGETVSNPTTHFKGFFNATTLTPAISNLNGIEGDEYKVTNGGVNVDFGSGDIFLRTDDIIIFYQSEWRVKVSDSDADLLRGVHWGNVNTDINTSGKVGVGTYAPYSRLANTNTNVPASNGLGVNTESVAWSVSQEGYTMAIENKLNSSIANGLLVKVANTSASRIIDFESGGVNIFTVRGNGNVGIGVTNPSFKLDVSGIGRFTSSVITGVFTVATLPTGAKGARAFVSDANASTFNSVVVGGGANNVPVFHDGTNWRIG